MLRTARWQNELACDAFGWCRGGLSTCYEVFPLLHSSLIPYPSTRVYPLQLVLWRTPLQPPRVDGDALRTVFRRRHFSGYVKATFDWIILTNLGNGSSCSVTLYLYKVAPVVDCPCFKLLLSIIFLLVRCEGLLGALAMCSRCARDVLQHQHSDWNDSALSSNTYSTWSLAYLTFSLSVYLHTLPIACRTCVCILLFVRFAYVFFPTELGIACFRTHSHKKQIKYEPRFFRVWGVYRVHVITSCANTHCHMSDLP